MIPDRNELGACRLEAEGGRERRTNRVFLVLV